MKCANCGQRADWSYKAPGTPVVLYCEKHLPTFLKKDRSPLTEVVETAPVVEVAEDPEPAPRRIRKKAEPVEEPVED